jgi:hypothetical protein
MTNHRLEEITIRVVLKYYKEQKSVRYIMERSIISPNLICAIEKCYRKYKISTRNKRLILQQLSDNISTNNTDYCKFLIKNRDSLSFSHDNYVTNQYNQYDFILFTVLNYIIDSDFILLEIISSKRSLKQFE